MDHLEKEQGVERLAMPVLALRDAIVYPHMVMPLYVGREKSIQCLDAAMDNDKYIFLAAQKEASIEDPEQEDLYQVGTIAKILHMLKMPDGTVKVLVEGMERAKLLKWFQDEPYFYAEVEELTLELLDDDTNELLMRSAMNQFEGFVKLNKKMAPEILTSLSGIEDASRLADTMAAHMPIKFAVKQKILEQVDIKTRLEHIMALMESEIDILQVEKKIRARVKMQMEKNQREYYLNEQMKAIQKELGETEDGLDEFEQYQVKIKKAKLPKEAEEKVQSELKKLQNMSAMSPEATVIRSYVDWVLSVPWSKKSRTKRTLKKAIEILDKEHYGLEKVKERIIDFLAVQQRTSKVRGPILCLVGPPGVGKTSLGQSIANATGRKYVRMALGGVRDEAEIRGHRRTYIGSMPGKLMQKMSKVGVRNPLFLLDEIDKMASDMRGDPASALLEVLDPEQNSEFNDHYLEVDYDLSDVMFVATSNSMNIPGPLLDRMEVIRLSGYTEDEKLNIAKKHLLPKQIERNGLKKKEIKIDDSAILGIIRYYTREAGVRNLERELSTLCRKAVRQLLLDTAIKVVKIDESNLEEFIGVRRYDFGRAEEHHQVGQVNGLAWTQVGGDLLTIEAACVPGKGKTVTTGSLGNVMKESISTAMTVVRSRAEKLRLDEKFYEQHDIHVHVPEGATPKDGPSAGIGMVTALISAFTENPVRANVAMTGEITLRGEVLAIGGLKEKLLAAHRGGITDVIIPDENKRHLKEIPENILADLAVHPVKWIDDVLDIALLHDLKTFTKAG